VLGILGITALLSALNTGLFIAGPRDPRTWVQIVIGVAGVAAYLWVNVGRMRERFTGRGAFFLLSSVVTGALVVAALGGLNYLAVKKAEDLGPHQGEDLHPLRPDGHGGLKASRARWRRGRLLRAQRARVRRAGSAPAAVPAADRTKLKVELLDPTKHVKEVKEFNISQGGPRVIVKALGKESRAKDVGEESLTNAIAEVTRGASKKIYFSKGHGERGTGDATERGMKLWVDGLKSEGYQIAEIELAATKTMPVDAQALGACRTGGVADRGRGEARAGMGGQGREAHRPHRPEHPLRAGEGVRRLGR